MIPEVMPVFTYEDILEPPAEEYEDGEVRTTLGWLKHLFLFQVCEDQPDCIQITPEDRKDYQKVLDKFRILCKMKRDTDLHEWEDQTSRKAQAAALNKLRKSLGYTVEVYV